MPQAAWERRHVGAWRGSAGTAWVSLGAWALSPARPTPIPPRHACRGFSALLVRANLPSDRTRDAPGRRAGHATPLTKTLIPRGDALMADRPDTFHPLPHLPSTATGM